MNYVHSTPSTLKSPLPNYLLLLRLFAARAANQVDLHTRDVNGVTPMHLAASSANVHALRVALEFDIWVLGSGRGLGGGLMWIGTRWRWMSMMIVMVIRIEVLIR